VGMLEVWKWVYFHTCHPLIFVKECKNNSMRENSFFNYLYICKQMGLDVYLFYNYLTCACSLLTFWKKSIWRLQFVDFLKKKSICKLLLQIKNDVLKNFNLIRYETI
jgi:hypothetical protein